MAGFYLGLLLFDGEPRLRVRSFNATSVRTRLATNQPLPLELCALTAINNLVIARRQARGDLSGKHTGAAVLHRAQPRTLAKKVAYLVGLNDPSYFTRGFKRRLGFCPSDYRAGAR